MVIGLPPRAEGKLADDIFDLIVEELNNSEDGAGYTFFPHIAYGTEAVRGHLNRVSANLIVLSDDLSKRFTQLSLVNASEPLLVPYIFVDSIKLAEIFEVPNDEIYACAIVNKCEDLPNDLTDRVMKLCYPHLHEYI